MVDPKEKFEEGELIYIFIFGGRCGGCVNHLYPEQLAVNHTARSEYQRQYSGTIGSKYKTNHWLAFGEVADTAIA